MSSFQKIIVIAKAKGSSSNLISNKGSALFQINQVDIDEFSRQRRQEQGKEYGEPDAQRKRLSSMPMMGRRKTLDASGD